MFALKTFLGLSEAYFFDSTIFLRVGDMYTIIRPQKNSTLGKICSFWFEMTSKDEFY